jgi:hypothetical protein
MRFLTLALLANSTLLLTECSKSSELAPPQLTEREKFLTAPNWQITSVVMVQTTPAGVVTSTEILPIVAPCSLDDFTHYNIDKTFTINEGALVCVCTETPKTWAFASNETELILGGGAQHHQIRSLSATTLSYAYTTTYPDGEVNTEIRTYSAR